jgi:hypothetical protein
MAGHCKDIGKEGICNEPNAKRENMPPNYRLKPPPLHIIA